MRRQGFMTGLVLFSLLSWAALGQAPNISENGKFTVDLSSPERNELLLGVFTQTNGARTMLWSRKIQWRMEDYMYLGQARIEGVKAHVSDDGEKVVLRDFVRSELANRLKIVSSEKEWEFGVFGQKEFTGAVEKNEVLRPNVSYLHVASILDFIDSERSSYSVWFGSTDKWWAVSLTNLVAGEVTNSSEVAHLNALARERVMSVVSEHQPSAIAKGVKAAQRRLANWLPSIVPAPKAAGFWYSELSPSYLFLVKRKDPADRKYIDGLLRFEQAPEAYGHASWMGGRESSLQLRGDIQPHERWIGDFFGRLWDGETNIGYFVRPLYLLVPDEPLRSYGTVVSKVTFPMKVSKEPGDLHGYLIPASAAKGEWMKPASTTHYNLTLRYVQQISHGSSFDEASVILKGIVPGAYRLKFVWERKPAAAGGMPKRGIYEGQPGDYESAESAEFVVRPADRVTVEGLRCTLRVGAEIAPEKPGEPE